MGISRPRSEAFHNLILSRNNMTQYKLNNRFKIILTKNKFAQAKKYMRNNVVPVYNSSVSSCSTHFIPLCVDLRSMKIWCAPPERKRLGVRSTTNIFLTRNAVIVTARKRSILLYEYIRIPCWK